ncbi:glycosyltransferase family 2 protein [Paenibacillus anseongense]|uniref:glycosyltransferase family 2 protein n=1 Tax=Paenibacillus TaxID=44249 RepID=UPI002DBD7A14|nr:glycosyltransferase family 2 protein [Paenibacillus anseongense]MEC0267339.1 glycosyltransferase family 2 protein [Paenibacillus anseongense]
MRTAAKRRVHKSMGKLRKFRKLGQLGRLGKLSKPGKVASSQTSYNRGYNEGFNMAYDSAHDHAFQLGWDAGVTPSKFQGTSIIIVTTNDQRHHLQNCIDSIYEYTPEPFELIVIDNASTDDTAEYLKSLTGKIRYKIFTSNLGFAGGTNQGLRMARGSNLLFLNNDTIVTKDWLKNMLTCLDSNEKFGLVGPMTNYISGEQLLQTNYTSTEEMHHFAANFNQSNPAKWHVTTRLTGFCVLMRREVFERLGYLDEGFEIGNCEDDDFGFRTRIMGLELVIAMDTFIHHVGSVSIKALGERRFEEVYGRNLEFYARKWGETHSLLLEVHQKLGGGSAAMVDFYPSHIVVRGVTSQLYWIENGHRHPIEGETHHLSATRVSQVDLRNWPKGHSLSQHDVQNKLAALAQGVYVDGHLQEGALARTEDHAVYQVKNGKMQRFINDWPLRYWNLDLHHQTPMSWDDFHRFAPALPIIAPAIIAANNV